MNFRFHAAVATAWCKSGHEVGWDQIALPLKTRKDARCSPSQSRPAKWPLPSPCNISFTVENDALQLVASREAGLIETLRWHGEDILVSGPRLQVWRGSIDNDGMKGVPDQGGRPLAEWRRMGGSISSS